MHQMIRYVEDGMTATSLPSAPEPCGRVTAPLTGEYYYIGGFRQMRTISVKRLVTFAVLGTERICLSPGTVEWAQGRDGWVASAD
jgi:hypothetical protein